MSNVFEQCTVDGELTPDLIKRKQELDASMEAELAAIDANKGNIWVPKERQYAEVRQKYEMTWEQELEKAGYMVRPIFESVEQWYDTLSRLNEARVRTAEDPYGYGPYKEPTDPTLRVGDYIKAKQYRTDDKWYPAQVTRITPDFVDYTISGFGFIKNGTAIRSASARNTFNNLRKRLGN